MQKALVSIYSDPEFYPPTRNAIFLLAEKYDQVIVLTRNNFINDSGTFPKNVITKKVGKFVEIRESERKNLFWKIRTFLTFLFHYQLLLTDKKIKIVLLYDAIPLFANLLSLAPKKKLYWYHNHDVPEINQCRKYSIGWFCSKYEHKGLKRVKLFSLPSKDRFNFYPQARPYQKYFYLPNFPLLSKFNNLNLVGKRENFTVIFQGAIGPNHGIEDLLKVMQNQKDIHLVLKGWVRDDYRSYLDQLISKYNITERVEWIGFTSYVELINLSASCTVGIGIHMSNDIMNSTLGTASNKIYEYLAAGLPVIVYDNEQFRKNLGDNDYILYYNGKNMSKLILQLRNNYLDRSVQARRAFELKFNFEAYFLHIMEDVDLLLVN